MALRTVARRKGDGASARGPVRGPAHQIIPEQRVPSLRLPVLSVQLARIAADGRASCKRQVSGSIPLTGSRCGLHVSVGTIFTFGSDILVRGLVRAWLLLFRLRWVFSWWLCACPGGLRARCRCRAVVVLVARAGCGVRPGARAARRWRAWRGSCGGGAGFSGAGLWRRGVRFPAAGCSRLAGSAGCGR